MSSNGEIIHLHVGQAGIQIANACWELYCLEHGVDMHGCMYDCPRDESFRTFFACSSTPKVVPRLVMVDSEPTVIDEIRTGTYGHLFKPETLISGKEDSGSNFARGYYTLGSELVEMTMNSIRCVAEACSNLKGFLLFRSIGGGTGSGLGDRLMENIVDDYGKITKMDYIIFPSPSISPLIVEPYNSILATHIGMESSDCTFILDNEALYDICENKLDVPSPTYTNLNRIIGQAVSAMTASLRFYGSTNVSFTEFQTNLVPYPRIHFPLVSYAPLVTMYSSCYTELTTEQLTFECFQPASQLVRCCPSEGKYMSCMLLYRGNVAPADINYSVNVMKEKGALEFVDWSPTGFKIGINSMPPCPVPGGDVGATDRAVMALSNNTVIHRAWCRLLQKFESLYSRRAYIHHFLSEGCEEGLFMEASEDICSLIQDYHEVESGGNDDKDYGPVIGRPGGGGTGGKGGKSRDKLSESGSKYGRERDEHSISPRILQNIQTGKRNKKQGMDMCSPRSDIDRSKRSSEIEPIKKKSGPVATIVRCCCECLIKDHNTQTDPLCSDESARSSNNSSTQLRVYKDCTGGTGNCLEGKPQVLRESGCQIQDGVYKVPDNNQQGSITCLITGKVLKEVTAVNRFLNLILEKCLASIEGGTPEVPTANTISRKQDYINSPKGVSHIDSKLPPTEFRQKDMSSLKHSRSPRNHHSVNRMSENHREKTCDENYVFPRSSREHHSWTKLNIEDTHSERSGFTPKSECSENKAHEVDLAVFKPSRQQKTDNIDSDRDAQTSKLKSSHQNHIPSTINFDGNRIDEMGFVSRLDRSNNNANKSDYAAPKPLPLLEFQRPQTKLNIGDTLSDGTGLVSRPKSSKTKADDGDSASASSSRPSTPHRSQRKQADLIIGDIHFDKNRLSSRSKSSEKDSNTNSASATFLTPSVPHRSQTELNIRDENSDLDRLTPKSKGSHKSDFSGDHIDRIGLESLNKNTNNVNHAAAILVTQSSITQHSHTELNVIKMHNNGNELVSKVESSKTKTNDGDRALLNPSRPSTPHRSQKELDIGDTHFNGPGLDLKLENSVGDNALLKRERSSTSHHNVQDTYLSKDSHKVAVGDDPANQTGNNNTNDRVHASSESSQSAILHCSQTVFNISDNQSDWSELLPRSEHSSRNPGVGDRASLKSSKSSIGLHPQTEVRGINSAGDGVNSRSKSSQKIARDEAYTELGFQDTNFNRTVLLPRSETFNANNNDGDSARSTIICFRVEIKNDQKNFNGDELVLSVERPLNTTINGDRASPRPLGSSTPSRPQAEVWSLDTNSDIRGLALRSDNFNKNANGKSNVNTNGVDLSPSARSSHKITHDVDCAPERSSQPLLPLGFQAEPNMLDINSSIIGSPFETQIKFNIPNLNPELIVPESKSFPKIANNAGSALAIPLLPSKLHPPQREINFGDLTSDGFGKTSKLENSCKDSNKGERDALKSTWTALNIRGKEFDSYGINPRSNIFHKVFKDEDLVFEKLFDSSTSNLPRSDDVKAGAYTDRDGVTQRSETSQEIANNGHVAPLNPSRSPKPYPSAVESIVPDTYTGGNGNISMSPRVEDCASATPLQLSNPHRYQPEISFESTKNDENRQPPKPELIANDCHPVLSKSSLSPKSRNPQTELNLITYSDRNVLKAASGVAHVNAYDHALSKPSLDLNLSRTEMNIWNTYCGATELVAASKISPNPGNYASSHLRSPELQLSRTEVNTWNTYGGGTAVVLNSERSPNFNNQGGDHASSSKPLLSSTLNHPCKELNIRTNILDRSTTSSESERVKRIAYYNEHASSVSSRSSNPQSACTNLNAKGHYSDRNSGLLHKIVNENHNSSKSSRSSIPHRTRKELTELLGLSSRSRHIFNRIGTGSSIVSGSRPSIRDHYSNRNSQRSFATRSSRSIILHRSAKSHYFEKVAVVAKTRISDIAVMREHMAIRRKLNMMTKIPTRSQMVKCGFPKLRSTWTDSHQQKTGDNDIDTVLKNSSPKLVDSEIVPKQNKPLENTAFPEIPPLNLHSVNSRDNL